MHDLILALRDVLNNYTLIIIILLVLFSLVVDGKNLKKKGLIKEYKIIKSISYSYIVLVILIFVLQRIS